MNRAQVVMDHDLGPPHARIDRQRVNGRPRVLVIGVYEDHIEFAGDLIEIERGVKLLQ
jgi:hypothetical protein